MLLEKHISTLLLGYTSSLKLETQYGLWDLICSNSIDQVIFVSAINNPFYRQAFIKSRKQLYAADEALAKTKAKIYEHPTTSDSFTPNLHLLAAHHLTNQKSRLLSTKYLGNQLTREKIMVKAYVYHSQEQVFYNLRETKQRGNLLDMISFN